MFSMFKGWAQSSYIIGMFGALVITILSLVTAPITGLGIFTLISGLFGFLSVILIINRKRQAGWVGLISAVGYIIIAFLSHNPSDSILNIFFILSLDLPIMFNKNWQEDTNPVSLKGQPKKIVFLSLVFVVLFVVLASLELFVLYTPRPYIDAFAATLGITASIITSYFKAPEGIVMFEIQNVFQAILWGITFLQGDAGITLFITYLFYTLNAGSGLLNGKWFLKEK